MTPPPRRRWTRLSLKMTLLLILAIGLGLGWWVNSARRQAAALALIARCPGSDVKYESEAGPMPEPDGSGRVPPRPRPWWPPRALEAWLGPDLFHTVVEVNLDLILEGEDIPAGPSKDEQIDAVVALRRLKVLTVQFDVDDARAAKIAGLTALENLDLPQFNVGLTDRGMKSIGSIATLKELRVNHQEVTPAGLAELGALSRLESLHTATMTTGPDESGRYVRPRGGADWSAGAAPLAKLARLKVLDLGLPRFRGEGLRHLGAIKTLKMLGVDRLEATDDDLRHLAGLADLQSLSISDTTIDGTGLRHLARIPGLNTVILLEAPRLADPAIAELAKFPGLAMTILDGRHLTIDGLLALRAAPHLALLELRPPVPDEAGRLDQALPKCKVDNGRSTTPGGRGYHLDLK